MIEALDRFERTAHTPHSLLRAQLNSNTYVVYGRDAMGLTEIGQKSTGLF